MIITSSANRVKICLVVSFPIWAVSTPVVPRLAVLVSKTNTSLMYNWIVLAPVPAVTTRKSTLTQVFSGIKPVVENRVVPSDTQTRSASRFWRYKVSKRVPVELYRRKSGTFAPLTPSCVIMK